jgi:Uma2 family endonuclease
MVFIVEDEPIVAGKPLLQEGRLFTRDDLRSMPDDGRRYEILDGTLVVSAAPTRVHQRAVGRLYRVLDDACPQHLEVLVAPFDVVLAKDSIVQPDALVASRKRLTATCLEGPPELAIEVLSPSTRHIDLLLKRERFERAGCPSYWLLDPAVDFDDARLAAWQLNAEKRYEQVADVTGEQKFHATLPYEVTVVPAELVW